MSDRLCLRCVHPVGWTRSTLCDACRDALTADGQFWCARCQRAHPAADRAHGHDWCGPCARAYKRDERRRRRGRVPPPGYVSLAEASRRLHFSPKTLTGRCARGVMPGAIQLGAGGKWWVPESILP